MTRPFTAADPAASPTTPDFWRAQIQAATDKRDKHVTEWRKNIQRYLAKTLSETPRADTIVVPMDYMNTEQKKALLGFLVPEVQLTARRPNLDTAVPVFQAVLNFYLGEDGVDALTMLNESLFDAIVPSGLAVTMIGYEPTVHGTKEIQVGTQPAPNVGDVLGLRDVVQVPLMQSAPNIIHEQYYWVRVSPEKALIPSDFHGSNYDLAPWLGVQFEIDHAVAKRKGWVTADTPLSGDDSQQGLNPEERNDASPRPKVKGAMIWYRMAHFDLGQPHPDAFGWCVLIDGRDDFAVQPSPSPWQKFVPDPASGKQTVIGMLGNPIHIRASRYVSDSAYPPSDVQMGQPQVEELSKGRSQMIRQRDRNVSIRGYDKTRVDPDTLKKIEKAEEQSLIGFDGNPNEQLVVLGTGQMPRENFEFDRIIKDDLRGIWGLGSNQVAQESDEGDETATEASIIQSNADTRLAKEQNWWLAWFVRGTKKVGGLIQLFADDTDYVEIVGKDGLAALVPWDKTTIAGPFAYRAVPNTNVRQDADTKSRRALRKFNLLANEPHVHRGELVRWLIREMDLPLNIYNPKPPEKGPEPARIQLTVSGEDLNPAAPQFPAIKAIFEQQGLQIPDDAIATGLALQSKVDQGGMADPSLAGMAQPGQLGAAVDDQHPGGAEEVSPLNKHQFDETGKLPGDGMAAAVQ